MDIECTENNVIRLVGTVFYIGCIPGPGGTYGSAVVFGAAALLLWAGISQPVFSAVWGVTAAAAGALSVYVGRHTERIFGVPDPNEVVIDEVAGSAVSLLGFPVGFSFAGLVCCFFLFRFFDIVKPLGIRRLEGLGGGWGLVADDAAAGLLVLAAAVTSGFFVR